jgi:protein-tyrosine phosphatase
MKILMVCLGNICRSPLAEGIMQHLIDENKLNWQVDSAGTNGYHNGEAPHHLSQKVAKLNGIDISHQISRKFTASDFDNYDIIYAMANDVVLDIKSIAGHKMVENKVKLFMQVVDNSNGDVPDPWYGAEDGYHKVFEIIKLGCQNIVAQNS